MRIKYLFSCVILLMVNVISSQVPGDINDTSTIQKEILDPATVLWYKQSAKIWEEALPVGNGRLGAMVYGRNGEEIIQFNEETYWSGGPYSTVVKGGHKMPALPKEWTDGQFDGVCARGGFELDFSWENNVLTSVEILSKARMPFIFKTDKKVSVFLDGKQIKSKYLKNGTISFETKKGMVYTLMGL